MADFTFFYMTRKYTIDDRLIRPPPKKNILNTNTMVIIILFHILDYCFLKCFYNNLLSTIAENIIRTNHPLNYNVFSNLNEYF